jgi:hypothetical protein
MLKLLVDNTDFSKLVPKDSLTIDGEKLAGIDDFTIDARRGKAEIRLLNTNQSQNKDIIDLLTDKTRLLEDGMETENINCIVASHEKALDAFSYERLFYRHFNGIDETWTDGGTAGIIKIQSTALRNIIYRTFCDGMIPTGSDIDRVKWINRFTAMLNKIIKNNQVDPSIQIYESTVKAFLLERIPWITDSHAATLADKLFTLLRYHYRSTVVIYNVIKDIAVTWYDIFDNYPPTYCVSLCNDDTGEENIYSLSYYAEFTNDKNRRAWIFADLISSIISWDDYDELVREYMYNNNSASHIRRLVVTGAGFTVNYNWSEKAIYTPFYQNKYITSGGTYFLLKPPSNFYHTFDNCISTPLIKFCKSNQRNLKIGKTQTKTYAESTDSGLEIESDDTNLGYWNMYVPVERTFTLEESDYFESSGVSVNKFYLDNININEMLSTPNNYLFATGFTETNWMYFDSIKCKERILLPNEDTFVDSIPVFDIEDESQVDNYGLYIYRDYFQKYYTKSASNVTDILVQLKDTSTNKVLFTGLIDFNTVKRTKKAITFEAIDAIGLLADNARKLNSIVHFSQFDTGGDGTIAEKKAGTTLKQFAETLIRTPFPYEHSLASSSFDIGNNDGLENKLLDTIETDKALVMAIQCAKKLLYVDGTGKIQTDSVLGGNTATIDGQIIAESISQNTDIDEIEFDQLKKVAGYDRFLPSIVSFYKSINYNYKERIDIEIHGQTSEIKLLDKIIYKSKEYFVMEKNINLSNGTLNITLIGEI